MTKTQRDSFYKLLQIGGRFESKRKRSQNKNSEKWLMRYFLWTMVAPFAIAVICAIIKKITGTNSLNTFALICLLIVYLASFLQPFMMILPDLDYLKKVIKEPFSAILDNANRKTSVDARLLPRLLRIELHHLQLFLLELQTEKECFEKRIALVAGPIEKIGLASGILALTISVAKLDKFSDWITSLAYIIAFFYLLAVAAHFILMRLERSVKLVELAIEQKSAEANNPAR